MNERIKELKNQTLDKHFSYTWSKMDYDDVTKFAEKFAELILQEHVELLKQRWYTLNNAAPENNETPRDIGMRVGQKAEVAHCIHLLSNHWKDRSDDPTEERQQDS